MVAINQREITIIRRYFCKQDYAPKGLHKGDVVLIVRNDQDKEYEVILRKNRAHICSCPAGQHGRKCYHVSTLVQVENARIEARKAARVVEMPAQKVVEPLAEKVIQFKKDWGKPNRQKEDWAETAALANSRAFKII